MSCCAKDPKYDLYLHTELCADKWEKLRTFLKTTMFDDIDSYALNELAKLNINEFNDEVREEQEMFVEAEFNVDDFLALA
jgi:hypothetical protein